MHKNINSVELHNVVFYSIWNCEKYYFKLYLENSIFDIWYRDPDHKVWWILKDVAPQYKNIEKVKCMHGVSTRAGY